MRRKLIVIILSLVLIYPSKAQVPSADSTLRAMGELVTTQAVLHALGRFVLDEPFSHTTMRSIRHNFKSPFAWDEDYFHLNSAGHAYQGSLMFNAARSNGFGFWQSVPFTVAGTLLWEYAGETEQPSINDLITTPLAGSLWGEVTHRLSHALTDRPSTSLTRFLREAAAAVINPVEGFHRLVDGRAWKASPTLAPQPSPVSVQTSLSLSFRGLTALPPGQSRRWQFQPVLSLAVDYGESADGECHASPFDFFSIDGAVAFGSKQHLLSHVRLTGRIGSLPFTDSQRAVGEVGIYQHFIYEDSHLPEQDGEERSRGPFPYGEMVSLGPGLHLTLSHAHSRWQEAVRLYAKGIALGAAESDYYHFYHRHYNMGSGYGAALHNQLSRGQAASLSLSAGFMHLFTWKGYEPCDISSKVYVEDGYMNVLGDRSNTRVLSVDSRLDVRLSPQLALSLGGAYFSRHTHYRYHPNRHKDSCELRGGLKWSF